MNIKISITYFIFMIAPFFLGCQGNVKKESNNNASADSVSWRYGVNENPVYEYTDANGKHLTIQNGLPRGEKYTHPKGDEYFKVIFWTRIINETDNPLELKINFPVDSYEIPYLPGKYYKILVPPDTMTVDEEPLYNYGLRDLKSFLDSSIHKASSLERTINPKESSGFYIVILAQPTEGVPGGILRTGLSLQGQNLFYRISRYASTPAHTLIHTKEIYCGSINVNLIPLK